ncbi:MAG: type II toxin-antitoxin system VapC family toxin [Bryobacteraceae bacterium]
MIVLDTNVISETLKPAPSDTVMKWLRSREPLDVFITTITQAEVLYGIELLPAGKRRNTLRVEIEKVFSEEFHDRILGFDEAAARAYARIAGECKAMGRPIAEFDAMIASICRSRQATIATRNVKHFEHCGISAVNPWRD